MGSKTLSKFGDKTQKWKNKEFEKKDQSEIALKIVRKSSADVLDLLR